MSKKLLEDDEKIIRQQIAFRKPYGEIINFMVNQLGLTDKEAQKEYRKQSRIADGPVIRDEKFLKKLKTVRQEKIQKNEIAIKDLSNSDRNYLIKHLIRSIEWMEADGSQRKHEKINLLIYRIALQALDNGN